MEKYYAVSFKNVFLTRTLPPHFRGVLVATACHGHLNFYGPHPLPNSHPLKHFDGLHETTTKNN